MHRLLIVDDEKYVVDDMETLFLSQNDTELEVYNATLATDALKIMEKVKIDVLLSDIKMPVMDGFALAERVKESWPDAKIIFLTAFNDFDLAYKTGKYGDITFLLKMEDENVIVKTVYDAIEKSDREREAKLLKEESINTNKVFRYSIKNTMLRDIMNGVKNVKPEEIEPDIDIERNVFVIVLNRLNADNTSYISRDRFAAGLSEFFKAFFGNKAGCELVRTSGEIYTLLLQWETPEEPDRIIRYLSMMSDEMMERLGRSGDEFSAVIIGYEMPLQKIMELLENIREEVQNDAPGSCRLFEEKDFENREGERGSAILWKSRFDKNIENIRINLYRRNKIGVQRELRPIAVAALEVDKKHFYPLIAIYQMLGGILLDYANDKNLINRLSFKIGIYKLFSVTDFNSWKEAFDYLFEVIDNIFEAELENRTDNEDRFISVIRKYIEDNLSGDLSLTAVSDYLKYNPSYVSRVFKKLSGRNYIDYISTVRLEHAADYLINTSLTVNEIAEKCGFESRQYFSSLFKKKYGKNPQDYRHEQVKK